MGSRGSQLGCLCLMAELYPQPSVAICSRWLGGNPKRNSRDYENDLKVTTLLELRTFASLLLFMVFSCSGAELSPCDQDIWPAELKDFLPGPLQREFTGKLLNQSGAPEKAKFRPRTL